MSPESQILLTKVLGAGLGGLLLFSVLWVTLPFALRQIYNLLRKVRMRELPAFVLLSVFVGGMILHGGSKNNPTNNTPPLLGMSLPQAGGLADNSGTVDQNQTDMRFREQIWAGPESNGLARIEKWFRRGAWEDGQAMIFDNDWRFPYDGEHLSSVEIWSQGGIYPSEKSPDPVVSIVTPLSLKPAETEVFCGRTTNNSYRVEWRNAHPNRDVEQLADAAIELCRDGNCIVTENGVTTVVPYDVPFAHNGFGQDADWVRANFTNAEEILAVGYRTWAEDQIGYDQLNGLYLFTASFAEDPPEATELYVGDYTVAVTNAGEYVFVLEKGTEYEFGTWPNDAEVEYWAQDDMSEDTPLLMSWWGYWDSFGTWTEDGGWSWLDYPSFYLGDYYPGYCCWLPTLRGSPDVSHLGPEDFPMEFEAVLTDYPANKGNVTYIWSTTDNNVNISSPNSQSTQISVNSLPSWGEFTLEVEAVVNGHSLYSYLYPSYGYHLRPQVNIAITGSSYVWVNRPEDNINKRTYSLFVYSDVPTNGIFRISFNGNTSHAGVNFLNTQEIQVDTGSELTFSQDFAVVEGLSACNTCDEEHFQWSFQTPDGVIQSGDMAFTVAEVNAVDVWSAKGGESSNPPPFPGQTSADFSITNSTSPDKHYPIFFRDVVDENIVIQPYSVEYRVVTEPTDFAIHGGSTKLTLLDGPLSGSIRNAVGKTAYFDTPRDGGVYKVGVQYADSPITETILVLPLAGASVDSVVTNDLSRADDAVSFIKSRYNLLQRQLPTFGLQWFNNEGMGDYLGRSDSVSHPTIWAYNQVNDDSGMGSVGTWFGLPIRMAKISNFMVGYATTKIGVISASRGLSQLIGTGNDASASLSWDAGVEIANGGNFHAISSAMVTNAWKVSDQKEKRLWPNFSPADNHVDYMSIRDFNFNFISPGFMERRPE